MAKDKLTTVEITEAQRKQIAAIRDGRTMRAATARVIEAGLAVFAQREAGRKAVLKAAK